jgi:uncharacterized GH25 family protein
MKRFSFLRGLTLIAGLLALGHAHAHHIWIEPTEQGAVLHFGEFADNLREVSPGLLDKFTATRATLVSAKGEQPLTVKKTPTAFELGARAGMNESIVAEADYPAFDKKDGDKILRGVWIPAARFVSNFAAQKPSLALDIVPTGRDNEFQVFYRGQPLPRAKVAAIAVSGWSREGETDENGKLSFGFPWQGLYGIEVKHSDKTPGERGGEKYDTASYVTTLSFVQPSGLTSPAAPYKKQPNK